MFGAAADDGAVAFIALGILLLIGLAADYGSRRLGLPSITILLVVGLLVGPEMLDLLPSTADEWFPVVSTLALTMVGFLLGAEFTRDHIREAGRADLFIAAVQGVATAVIVGGGLWLAGADAALALPLAGIAVATAPAATLAVVHEQRASGPFTRSLIGVVALDDVIALALFGMLASAAAALTTGDGGASLLGRSAWEIFGAVGLGIAVGLPAAALTGRLRPGRPTQEEAYAIVLLCAGLATLLEVSYLLAAVVLGATLANRAGHHEIAFHEIERIEWPALIVFFVLAGASLDLSSLTKVGWLGFWYVALRSVGKVAGCVAAGSVAGLAATPRRWLGLAMLPQAGVAIGLSLLAAERFPEVADQLLAIVIAATVVFELTGPIFTKTALRRTSEARREPARATVAG
jgi:Kef-type K+ transport system membrane component KefB